MLLKKINQIIRWSRPCNQIKRSNHPSEVSRALNRRRNLPIRSINPSSPSQSEEPRNRNRTRIRTQPVRGSQIQIKTIIAGTSVHGAQLLASLEDLDLAHDEVCIVGLHHHPGVITDVEPPAASLVRHGVGIRVFL